jgi:hypothetical protein
MYSYLGPVEGEDEGDCGETLPETVTFIISQHFKLYTNPGLTHLFINTMYSANGFEVKGINVPY